ncbi:MAG: GIY-YIG nuclease family protein [Gordonia sp. (in: high G+C Gram-positive bacteria)]
MADNAPPPAFLAEELDELATVPVLALSSVTEPRRELRGLSIYLEWSDGLARQILFDGHRWQTSPEDPTSTVSEGSAPDAENTAIGVWPPLLTPELRILDSSGTGDGFRAQMDYILLEHARFIDLYRRLVASGWRVFLELTQPEPGSSAEQASIAIHAEAPKLDPQRAAVVVQSWNWHAPVRSYSTVWYSDDTGTGIWDFDANASYVETVDDKGHYVSPDTMLQIATAMAPSWTLRHGVDRDMDRHSDGNAMAATILTPPMVEPAAPPTRAEIARRRAAVAEWAEANGFTTIIEPATHLATKQLLADLGLGTAGYYLLEFENGDCYLGQSIDIAERLKGHRTLRKDITSIRPQPDRRASSAANPLRHLLAREREFIASMQFAGLPSRNKAEMTYLTGSRPLDEIFTAHGLTASEWLADPIGANATVAGDERNLVLPPHQRSRSDPDYRLWLTRTGPQAAAALSAIRTYMDRCLPLPRQTEYDYWVLSAPAVIPRHGTLSNLSIGWTEAFRINQGLSGWVMVNGVELFGEDMADTAITRFLRRHPGVYLDEATYQAAGPFNYNVRAKALDQLIELLDDTAVTRAAATAALHLMRKSKVGAIKNSHNPVLVDAAFPR